MSTHACLHLHAATVPPIPKPRPLNCSSDPQTPNPEPCPRSPTPKHSTVPLIRRLIADSTQKVRHLWDTIQSCNAYGMQADHRIHKGTSAPLVAADAQNLHSVTGGKASWVAKRDIAAGEELNKSYIDLESGGSGGFWSVAMRRKTLKESKLFLCGCLSCVSYSDGDTRR